MAAHEVPDVKEMNELGPPPFRPSCSNCNFCDGLREMDVAEEDERAPVKDSGLSVAELFKSLPFLDRYLAVFILLAMIAGVLIGVYKEEAVQHVFNVASWQGTSI
ncbi:arsenite resistance protein ArsB, partial [Rhizoctonia solani 123E]